MLCLVNGNVSENLIYWFSDKFFVFWSLYIYGDEKVSAHGIRFSNLNKAYGKIATRIVSFWELLKSNYVDFNFQNTKLPLICKTKLN